MLEPTLEVANSTQACHSCVYLKMHPMHIDDVTPVYGSGYGPGTGAQLAVCMQTSFLELVLVEECSSNPDAQRLCSHDRDAGVRCQPGLCKL